VFPLPDRISEAELMSIIKKLSTAEHQGDTDIQGLEEEVSDLSLNGTITVQDNRIIVTDSEGHGVPALVQAVHPLRLRKNGKLVEGTTAVTSKDHLDWEIDDQALFKIEVSPDKMTAYFRLNQTERYAWRLKQAPAQSNLILEAEQDKSMVLETINMPSVMHTLQKMGIRMKVTPSSVFQELQNPTYQPVVVAQGIPVIPSQDARLDLYFNEQVESNYEEVLGTIDFRNHLRIPSARKGDVIAKKIPLVEGSGGYDVFGNPIRPNPPKDIVIIAKENVEITAANEVIALKEGRPRVTGNSVKYFDLSTAYVVSGDVNLKTGNIVFSGDVIVYGNVTDGMIIESLGNVYISGNVYRATVTATGSITVLGNIIGSNLYSGYFGVIFNRLYGSTKKLADMFQGIVDGSKVLISLIEAKGKSVTPGQVMFTLIESKYKEVPQLTKEILGCISSIQNINPEELHELKQKLALFLQPIRLFEVDSVNYLLSSLNLLNETYQAIERLQEHQVLVDIQQCHLSTIKSNGNIVIKREGVLQSSLFSKENILFYHYDAACRGSKLEAGGTISAVNVGGETGGETSLRAGKRIFVKKMTGGRVAVGRYFEDILEPIEHCAISIRNNKLWIEQETESAEPWMRGE
jgi:uncharacterized protein